MSDIKGGNRKTNAAIMLDILRGKERGAKREVVLLNSAFCLLGTGMVSSLKEGVKLAAELIDSGKAIDKLNQLIEFSRSFNS